MMSAENWAICPQCKRNEAKKLDNYLNTLAKAYGKVSLDTFEEMKAKTPSGKVSDKTLREDYRIGIDHEGNFWVAYSGGCDRCRFSFDYKYEKQVFK